ncbi:Uncharacterised protein [Shigella sonnei]|nr:Uncharacterised protein [Shigella sonnei]
MPLLFCVFSGGWVSGFRHYPLCRSGRSRTARAPDGKTARVVIETMGYEDSDYCARKSRQHTGMKQIGVLHTDPPKWLDNDHPPFEKHMYGVFMHLRY